MKILQLLAYGFGLALVACGPIYETTYRIVPPPTAMGRMCANNCLLSQQNCEQSCTVQEQQCKQIAELKAQNDYNEYVRRRQKEGSEIKKSVSSFDRSYRCNSDDCEERCQSSYHICHSNCGGQVIPTTQCVMGCD